MFRLLANAKIGIKLAIASLASILLVGGVIYVQLNGNIAVKAANDSVVRLQTVLHDMVDAKASARGMQIGVRDIRLAETLEELQKANEYLLARQKSAYAFTEEAEKLTQNQDQLGRLSKYKSFIGDYGTNAQDIVTNRAEAIAVKARQREAGNDAQLVTPNLLKLNDEAKRIARERTLPIAAELEVLANAIVEHAKSRAVEQGALAAKEMSSSEKECMLIATLSAAVLIATCIFSNLTIARPMTALARAMQELAGGNFSVVLPGLGRNDEIGGVAEAVEAFKIKSAQKAHQEAEAKVEADRVVAKGRRAEMAKLADSFEGAVGEIIQTVSSAATELEASANSLTSTAARTEELSTMVAAAAEEASTNVQSVASASEEMSSSVNEISRQVQESARIAGDAVSQAETTNARVNELSESAKKIGDVVKLISTIAEQTNLLALNATIEAARAGEAGRGFAVVASEVKALAEQTSKATGEIGHQIAAIQTATEGSVVAIREIGQTIGRISEISSTIAAAVEEQGAATQEISRNVQQAAQGTSEVAANISDVQRGSSETGSASSQVLSSAQSLSVESNRLKTEVQNFLATVRAA